jgi:hypothetical protein
LPRPTLAPNETLQWAGAASREQSALRYTGGRLFLTSDRLIFQQNRLDALTGGRSWATGLENVTNVGVEPSVPTVPFLGLAARNRKRLRVDLRDDDVEVFMINHLTTIVPMLTAALNEYRER